MVNLREVIAVRRVNEEMRLEIGITINDTLKDSEVLRIICEAIRTGLKQTSYGIRVDHVIQSQ